jgi:hypothetical protein
MVDKITIVVAPRQNAAKQIIARTGAVMNESLSTALERSKRYVGAGADMTLTMADTDDHWQKISNTIQAPLVTFAPFAGGQRLPVCLTTRHSLCLFECSICVFRCASNSTFHLFHTDSLFLWKQYFIVQKE